MKYPNKAQLDKALEIFRNRGDKAAVDYLVNEGYSRDTAQVFINKMIDDLYDLAIGSWR